MSDLEYEQWINDLKYKKSLKLYCENIIHSMKVSGKNIRKAEILCQDYGEKVGRYPTKDEISDILLTEKIERGINSNRLRKMEFPEDEILSPINSVVELIIKNPEDGSKMVKMKDVFFDTGGFKPEVSARLCKHLGLKRKGPRHIKFSHRVNPDTDEQYIDTGYIAKGDICIDLKDINNNDIRKCIKTEIKCIDNLEEDMSLSGKVYKIKEFEMEKGKFSDDGRYQGLIGDRYLVLLKRRDAPYYDIPQIQLDEALYGIKRTKDPLILIFDSHAPDKRPKIVMRKNFHPQLDTKKALRFIESIIDKPIFYEDPQLLNYLFDLRDYLRGRLEG